MILVIITKASANFIQNIEYTISNSNKSVTTSLKFLIMCIVTYVIIIFVLYTWKMIKIFLLMIINGSKIVILIFYYTIIILMSLS